MNKEEATKLWSYAAGTLNSENACMNMACHYKMVRNNRQSCYYMEKSAILGSVEAR